MGYFEPYPGTLGVQPPTDGLGTTYTARRLFIWSSIPPQATFPSATGQAVHGVSGPDDSGGGAGTATRGLLACKGRPFLVEAGTVQPINAGDALKAQVNGSLSGRVIPQAGSGTIVATALEGATNVGQLIWAVFV
ncbi:MAG: hypothetical protein ACJ796_08925 [Gemmatimonadaceae bacterium]